MYRNKRVLTILAIVLTVLLLAACGSSEPTPEAAPETEAATEAETASEAEAAPEDEAVSEEEAAPEEETAAEEEAVTEETDAVALMMENPPVTVLTQRPIEEVIGEQDVAMPAVSPDGMTIAWIKPASGGIFSKDVGKLCLYTFANADNVCVDKPEEYNSYPAQLTWSPDSAYVTFSENPFQLGHESDIWVFDAATSEFTNVTDDGQYGSWNSMETGTFELDYLPMWNADDGLIYFWRSVPSGELNASFDIYRISPTGGEAELVRDLPESVTATLPVWDFEFFYMDGPSAVAPDGSQVAVLVSSVFETDAPPSDGLWVIDLTDAEAEPQQLATVDDFQAAKPPWLEFSAHPLALSWTSDSQSVVALAQSSDGTQQYNNFYNVNIESGEMAIVNDFSGVETREAYFTPSDPATIPPLFYSPWTATVSPAGDKLLMWTDLTGVSGMFVSVQPPDGEIPGLVHGSELTSSYIRTRVSTSEDGKVIMYGLLLTIEEE